MATVLMDGRLLRPSEVADALAVSTKTVLRLIQAGQLAAVRVGDRARIRPDELDRYLAANSVGTDADGVA